MVGLLECLCGVLCSLGAIRGDLVGEKADEFRVPLIDIIRSLLDNRWSFSARICAGWL